MRAGVARALVKADPGDKTARIRAEFQPNFDRVVVTLGGVGRNHRRVPDRAWAGARQDRQRWPCRGLLEIAAVVDGSTQQSRCSWCADNPVVTPDLVARRRVPCCPTV